MVKETSEIATVRAYSWLRSCADTLDDKLRANIDVAEMEIYPASKLVQLLNAQYWKRQLAGKCEVVAVSPGEVAIGYVSALLMRLNRPDWGNWPRAEHV